MIEQKKCIIMVLGCLVGNVFTDYMSTVPSCRVSKLHLRIHAMLVLTDYIFKVPACLVSNVFKNSRNVSGAIITVVIQLRQFWSRHSLRCYSKISFK